MPRDFSRGFLCLFFFLFFNIGVLIHIIAIIAQLERRSLISKRKPILIHSSGLLAPVTARLLVAVIAHIRHILLLGVAAYRSQSIVFHALARLAFGDPGHFVSKYTTQNIFKPGTFIFSGEPGEPF